MCSCILHCFPFSPSPGCMKLPSFFPHKLRQSQVQSVPERQPESWEQWFSKRAPWTTGGPRGPSSSSWSQNYFHNATEALLAFLHVLAFSLMIWKQRGLLWWLRGKEPPAKAVRDLIPGWEDPLKKGMATHSSIPAWEMPWTEEPGRLQSRGCKQSDKT